MELELEKEFEQYAFIHKSSIVLAALRKYYFDLDNSGVSIPDFMAKDPALKAQEHYYELLQNREIFNKMYEECWDKYKEVLP